MTYQLFPYDRDVADVPWLDDREQRAWRGYLASHTRLMGHLTRQLQRDTGLSDGDYAVLVNLSETPGERLRAFQLGQAMQWEKSRLSHHLTRMTARGLVAREECPSDGRGAYVVLTATGRAAIEGAAPLHVQEVRRLFVDALSGDQLDALGDICDALRRRLDAAGDSDPCC
jgi:DNA-binding MarR family transcriptional regulator